MTALESLLAEIEKAEASATHGQWESIEGAYPQRFGVSPVSKVEYCCIFGQEDAEFIALSRNSIKKLIEIIRLQQSEITAIGSWGELQIECFRTVPDNARQCLKRIDEIAGQD